MFTGIVEEIGTIKKVTRGRSSAVLEVQAAKVLEDAKLGDSIAVNGVCLTVTSIHGNSFTADVMHETLDRSSLAALKSGSHVNLERAMAADGRFGGHMVAGHVDGVGTVKSVARDDNAVWYTIQAEPQILHYIVEKGSITIDGISLTVARVTDRDFAISAIPTTVQITILGERKPGDRVNLENDIVGKYIEKFLGAPCEHGKRSMDSLAMKKGSVARDSKITSDFLSKYGY